MTDPISFSALGGIALFKSVEKIVEILFDEARKVPNSLSSKISIKKGIRQLRNHIEETRRVKTLWQVDRAVDLLDFYCDSHILYKIPSKIKGQLGSNIRKKISNVTDFGTNRSVLVQGIAGQGKSILLRYLCYVELKRGQKIPIFIDLHKIQDKESLIFHITRALQILGFNEIQFSLLKTLCETNKILIFLDGYDEIQDSDRSRILSEIEVIDSFSPGIFVISSRPDSGIEMSPYLDVVKLDDLIKDEYQEVIKKLMDDPKKAELLIKKIKGHSGKISELLCTPLLVTLLVITYKMYQELPNQLSDFYDRIFQDLLQRHDGSKPGFSRNRRCKLNDRQYRQVFDCLCYYVKASPGQPLKYDNLVTITTEALRISNISVPSEDFLRDIIKVTCLILQDGDRCRFIHKSVQEYYASSFIKNRSEPVSEKFYQHCLKTIHQDIWDQELLYLSEIDPYRYKKFYQLPFYLSILGKDTDLTAVKPPQITITKSIELIGSINLGINETKAGEYKLVSLRYSRLSFDIDLAFELFKFDITPVVAAIKEGAFQQITNNKPDEQEKYFIPISKILEKNILTEKFLEISQLVINRIYAKAKETFRVIRSEETISLNIPQLQ